MTFYQELQLNQAGSKNVVRQAEGKKEKCKHMAIYIFKVFLTSAFCIAFVILFSQIFGSENSIAGVVVLLCVLAFRFADFGIRTSEAMWVLPVLFAILAFGPKLANSGGLLVELLVNSGCILAILVLGCHNVIMFNHSTLVLGYLLLCGYDVTGTAYLWRLAGLAVGGAVVMVIYYRNHRKQTYKRGLKDLLREFDLKSTRTRWQIKMTFGISTVMLLVGLLGFPRKIWAGIAVMSIIVPFQGDLYKRVKGRIFGSIAGGLLFIPLYHVLPEPLRAFIGIFSGIGGGFCATYGFQTVFNAFAAMAIAVTTIGLEQAVQFRIINNVIGAVYGLLLTFIFSKRKMQEQTAP